MNEPGTMEHERSVICCLLTMEAIEHELAAEESARNEETDDEQAHLHEASVWRKAAALVHARSAPVVAEPAVEEIPDDDIKF